MILNKASVRLYILRVCKYYGYSMEDLTMLFNSLIMSVFLYAIEVWACAYRDGYIKRIDKFCRRAGRFGYTTNVISINDLIEKRVPFMEKIISKEKHCLYHLLPKNGVENYVTENMILCCRKFELNGLSDVLSTDVFFSYNILLHFLCILLSIHVHCSSVCVSFNKDLIIIVCWSLLCCRI